MLGADPAGHPGFSGPYTAASMFHEPFVLYGYLAAVAPKLELVTGIIILPQRQTALVAKQAAEVDILTGGRFRLGVGQGWNTVEYEALGMDWADRRPADGGADRAPAAALAGAGAQLRGPLPHDHGRRDQPASGAAADPDLDGRLLGARRSSGSRGSPTATSRSRTRSRRAGPRRSSGCVTGGARPAATRTTSGSRRGSTPPPERPTTGTGPPRSGGRSARRTSRSTRCAAASTEPTPTSPGSPRLATRSSRRLSRLDGSGLRLEP